MKYDYKGLTISIETDDSPVSPREWDNLGTMVCFHRRYELGDKGHGYKQEDYSSWSDLEEAIRENEGQDTIILPLWLLDHSGISMSCGARTYPYDCQWDSGQVGFVFLSMAKAIAEWGGEGTTSADGAERCLKAEVETYDMYVRGDVHGFTIADPEGEPMESCWGFYGRDYCQQEAESMVNWIVKDRADAEEKARLAEEEKQFCLLGC